MSENKREEKRLLCPMKFNLPKDSPIPDYYCEYETCAWFRLYACGIVLSDREKGFSDPPGMLKQDLDKMMGAGKELFEEED